MQGVLNIAAYLFTPIDDPQALRSLWLARALALELKGTVLIAGEGVNLFLAGAPPNVNNFLTELRADPRFAALQVKESWSQQQPFRRMLVKVKREIIRMNHPAIQPAAARASSVPAATLKRWLDQGHDDNGQPVLLLDTRNAFEVDYGSFNHAQDWRIERFSDFPAAAAAHREELLGKTVVSFCTGGIRCEKAALYLREIGVDNVHQLEGGILKYFEEVGGAHYQGECFVFDGREALAPDLSARSGLTSARAIDDSELAQKL